MCINKHGKALSSISAVLTSCFLVLMHDDFLNKLMRKIHAEQCFVLWTQQTHACFQLGLSAVHTSDAHEQDTRHFVVM